MNETIQAELEKQIQHLVDGDLGEERRMTLLQRIDEEAPAAWRTVALGYVEADVLRSCFATEEKVSELGNTIPISRSEPSKPSRYHATTALIAATMMLLGVFLGTWFRSNSSSSETEDTSLVETIPAESQENIPPSFQAIESLDLALRDQGLEPVISNAIYQAELPDGRRLLLPVQRLSFNP